MLNELLGFRYLLQITKGLRKKANEPFFAAGGFREIELMKKGEFFSGMEDGEIVECCFVYFHDHIFSLTLK
jgi:hypothetical protein